jgi:hypothetical protein
MWWQPKEMRVEEIAPLLSGTNFPSQEYRSQRQVEQEELLMGGENQVRDFC